MKNLFAASDAPGEIVELILQGRRFRLERIASNGEASPPDFWYDQDTDEWVTLLKGNAVIEYDDGRSSALEAGDSLNIPAHERHRVAEVSQDAIWLAFHFHRGE